MTAPSLPTGQDGEQGAWTMVWQPWLDELLAAADEVVQIVNAQSGSFADRLETAIRTMRAEP